MTSTLLRPTDSGPGDVPARWSLGASFRAARDDWATRSTPALLRAARLLVVLLIVATGALAFAAGFGRDAAVTAITTRIEPLNADAATVYRALADADATVVSEYLAGGDESTAGRGRYSDDIAAAAAGLTDAAAKSDDDATTDRITELARQLPVYAELIEQARANNRQGLPVGTAYLGRASDLMQGTLLPIAESLQERQTRLLAATFDKADGVPVTALVVAIGTLVAVLLLQLWLALQFRRVLNAGMLVAAVGLLIGLGWTAIASAVAGGHLATSQAHANAVGEALVPAQIAALQARAAEGIALVRHDSGAEQTFADSMELLARDNSRGGALGAATALVIGPTAEARVADADAAVAAYQAAHVPIGQAVAEGNYADAVRLAVATTPQGPTAAFGRLDGALVDAVTAERAAFAREVAAAQAWRSTLVGVAIGTGLVAAVTAAVGLTRRLKDYP